ncbi:Eukaryotic translation initiation factor 3 subunit E [Frankliniella fusca]|uniref:Eukaryotic translation initiation factor 3 subunit E n=1 Tax=Frankliniella fusca TaxID=407009 RepID=A0AAE1HX84_9NEOP|nr:Eukaryotic translation initiation factor 3 subunit E [Frankliniella fusca]
MTKLESECESKSNFIRNEMLLGDNLGLHSVGGFVESLCANYFCRFCKTHSKVASKQVEEDKSLSRTEQSYNSDLALGDVSQTGVKGECAFNALPWHITEIFVLMSFMT